MTTKKTISALFLVFFLMNLSMWLGESTGHKTFVALGVFFSLIGFVLMLYAAAREKKGDKSETVLPKAAAFIFGIVGLWIAFICYRNWPH